MGQLYSYFRNNYPDWWESSFSFYCFYSTVRKQLFTVLIIKQNSYWKYICYWQTRYEPEDYQLLVLMNHYEKRIYQCYEWRCTTNHNTVHGCRYRLNVVKASVIFVQNSTLIPVSKIIDFKSVPISTWNLNGRNSYFERKYCSRIRNKNKFLYSFVTQKRINTKHFQLFIKNYIIRGTCGCLSLFTVLKLFPKKTKIGRNFPRCRL